MVAKLSDINILIQEIKKIKNGNYNMDFMRFVIDSSLVFLGAIIVIKEYKDGVIQTFRIDTVRDRITYEIDGITLAWCGCPPTLREQFKEYAKNKFLYKLQNKEKILF